MINLLKETLDVLRKNGKEPIEIVWIGCKDFEIPISNFYEMANVEYNNGYGSAKVPLDLVVVGEDWWLERAEYDGSEWWVFKEKPKMPSVRKEVKTLFPADYSDRLSDCLADEDDSEAEDSMEDLERREKEEDDYA